jgi:hypothetical protein
MALRKSFIQMVTALIVPFEVAAQSRLLDLSVLSIVQIDGAKGGPENLFG